MLYTPSTKFHEIYLQLICLPYLVVSPHLQPPGAQEPWFIEPPEPPVSTPAVINPTMQEDEP